jgi:hypothetical protein
MLHTIYGMVHDGKIEPTEPVDLPEGATVLVTLLPPEEETFWLAASQTSLDCIWNNLEDDVYAELLKKCST